MWNRRDWLGKLEGLPKRAVEGQAGRCRNWDSGPFVLALVEGSVSLLPELLEGGVFLAHFVSRGLQSVCTAQLESRILEFCPLY